MTFREWLITKLGGFTKEDVDREYQRGRYTGAAMAREEERIEVVSKIMRQLAEDAQ